MSRLLASLLLASLLLASAAAAADAPPNVVLIFCDDLGYADVGPFGAPPASEGGFDTPNLDRMAADGIRLTDFYVSTAVCSASRAALLTGCYNARVGMFGAIGPSADFGLHPDEVTIADLCRSQGYATAAYGKWHLGDEAPVLPTANGFDEYFGLPYSNDMWPLHPAQVSGQRPDWWPPLPLLKSNAEGDKTVVDAEVTAEDQKTLTKRYTQHAVDFIARKKDGPFFLYLAHSMPHVPLFVSEAFEDKTPRGLYGDVIAEVDWSVGQVRKALEDAGVADNTLVIFTSDNGPWLTYGDHAGSATPLREGKGTIFEGGVREPFLAVFPGKIPAGESNSEPAMTIDVLPTVAALIGASLPDRTIDGRDIWPLLTNHPQAKSPHEALFFYWGKELQAVRMGDWKLHFPHNYRHVEEPGTDGKPGRNSSPKIELSLFNLRDDIGETTDVKDANPEVVTRIGALADEMREDLGDSRLKVAPTGARPVLKF